MSNPKQIDFTVDDVEPGEIIPMERTEPEEIDFTVDEVEPGEIIPMERTEPKQIDFTVDDVEPGEIIPMERSNPKQIDLIDHEIEPGEIIPMERSEPKQIDFTVDEVEPGEIIPMEISEPKQIDFIVDEIEPGEIIPMERSEPKQIDFMVDEIEPGEIIPMEISNPKQIDLIDHEIEPGEIWDSNQIDFMVDEVEPGEIIPTAESSNLDRERISLEAGVPIKEICRKFKRAVDTEDTETLNNFVVDLNSGVRENQLNRRKNLVNYNAKVKAAIAPHDWEGFIGKVAFYDYGEVSGKSELDQVQSFLACLQFWERNIVPTLKEVEAVEDNMWSDSDESVVEETPRVLFESEETYCIEMPVFDNEAKRVPGESVCVTGLDKNVHNIFKFCSEKAMEFSRFGWATLRDADRQLDEFVLTNPPMSGKTDSALFVATGSLALGRNVVMVVMNLSEHCQQLTDSFEGFKMDMDDAGSKLPEDAKFVLPTFPVINLAHSITHTQLRQIEKGGCFIIGLCNSQQLKNLRQALDGLLETGTRPPLDYLLDESDALLKKKKTRDVLRDNEGAAIRAHHADRFINITATPFAHMNIDFENVPCKNFVKTYTHEDYVGVGHELFRMMGVVDKVGNYKILQNFDKFRSDEKFPQPWFVATLLKHANLPPRTTNEPHDLIIKITDLTKNQVIIQDWLIENFPNNPSIVDNSSQISLYLPDFEVSPSPAMWFPRGNYAFKNGKHTWNNTLQVRYPAMKKNLQSIYRDYGITDRCLYEIIGRKADRGVRFKTDDHEFAPDGMLLIASDKVAHSIAVQAACRIAGRRGRVNDDNGTMIGLVDPDPKYLYTTDTIIDTINNGNQTMADYLMDSTTDRNANISDIVTNVGVTEQQIKTQMTPQISKGEQRNTMKRKVVRGALGDPKRARILEDEKEGIDAFLKAFHAGTAKQAIQIVKIYQANDFQIYYISELINITGIEKLQMSNFTIWDLDHAKYKILEHLGSGRYQLRQCIIDALGLVSPDTV